MVGVMEGGTEVDVNDGEGTITVIIGVEVHVYVGGGARVEVGVFDDVGGDGVGGGGSGLKIKTHKVITINAASAIRSLGNRRSFSMCAFLICECSHLNYKPHQTAGTFPVMDVSVQAARFQLPEPALLDIFPTTTM